MKYKGHTQDGAHFISTLLQSREIADLLESSVGSDLQVQLLYVLLLQIAQKDECH